MDKIEIRDKSVIEAVRWFTEQLATLEHGQVGITIDVYRGQPGTVYRNRIDKKKIVE